MKSIGLGIVSASCFATSQYAAVNGDSLASGFFVLIAFVLLGILLAQKS